MSTDKNEMNWWRRCCSEARDRCFRLKVISSLFIRGVPSFCFLAIKYLVAILMVVAPLATAISVGILGGEWAIKHIFPAFVALGATGWISLTGALLWHGFKGGVRNGSGNNGPQNKRERRDEAEIEETLRCGRLTELMTLVFRGSISFLLLAAFLTITWEFLQDPDGFSSPMVWVLSGFAAGCLVLVGYLLKQEN